MIYSLPTALHVCLYSLWLLCIILLILQSPSLVFGALTLTISQTYYASTSTLYSPQSLPFISFIVCCCQFVNVSVNTSPPTTSFQHQIFSLHQCIAIIWFCTHISPASPPIDANCQPPHYPCYYIYPPTIVTDVYCVLLLYECLPIIIICVVFFNANQGRCSGVMHH